MLKQSQIDHQKPAAQIKEGTEESFKLLEEPKSERKLGLRRITEEQAIEIRGEKFVQQERNTNLKMLLNLRPGVFDPEDQA